MDSLETATSYGGTFRQEIWERHEEPSPLEGAVVGAEERGGQDAQCRRGLVLQTPLQVLGGTYIR